MERIRLIIHGRVQGVFFRQFTSEKAGALGLRGIVRNLPNGTVEVIAEGDTAKLDALADWCRNTGSPMSYIDFVEEERSAARGDLEEFTIRR